MPSAGLHDILVIDADTHVTEPPDLWTSRVEKKFANDVPVTAVHPKTQHTHWRIGENWILPVGHYAYAGWDQYPPVRPWEYSDIDPAAWQAPARLQRMDEYGIHAQVLYPNIIGFEAPLFMRLEPALSFACVRAYNDFITEFAAVDRDRLIPISMLPFWDQEAAIAELHRCSELGHTGVLFANKFEDIGLPGFQDDYWDPILAAAQDLDMSINFHVGFASSREGVAAARVERMIQDEATFSARAEVAGTAIIMLSLGNALATLVTSGICDRFPRLKFVMVESGFGYLPYLLESLDWHWKGYGLHRDHPMLPSEYFRRQCYGSFWFERTTLDLLSLYPDNVMFQTDFPHPTSLSPGPASPAQVPSEHIAEVLGKYPEELARKVLNTNAAHVYRIGSSS